MWKKELKHKIAQSRIGRRYSNIDSPLFKGVLLVGSGTLLAQVITVLILPLLTRLYTPEDFGYLAVYGSILSILGVVSILRYDYALALPRDDREAIDLMALSFLLLLLTTAIFGSCFLIWGDLIIDTLGLGSFNGFLALLLAGLFFSGAFSILNNWAIRKTDYGIITVAQLGVSVASSAGKVIFSLFSLGGLGLILGQLISIPTGFFMILWRFWNGKVSTAHRITVCGIAETLKKYKSFPIYNLPSSLIYSISALITPIILLYLYDPVTVGHYSLAFGLLMVPAGIVIASIAQPFTGEAAKLMRNGSMELVSFYKSTIKKVAVVVIPIMIPLSVLAPLIFPPLFGDQWVDAGRYCIPLALMIIPQSISGPTSKLHLYGLNHWAFLANLFTLVLVLAGFYISWILQLPAFEAIIVYSAIMSVMYLLSIPLNITGIRRYQRMHGNFNSR